MKKSVYDTGFSTCLTNYLKQETPSDIPLMKLTNSELKVKALTLDKANTTYNFSDSISINATVGFKDAIPSSDSTKTYIIVKTSSNKANPFSES